MGRKAGAGNRWEHCRLSSGRCKLRSFGGSTSLGEDHHVAFAHFKTKLVGDEGLREDRCGPEWSEGVGKGEGSTSHRGDHSTGDAQQREEADLHPHVEDRGPSQPIDMAKMYQMGRSGGVEMRRRNSLPFLERSPRHRYPPTSNPSRRGTSGRQCPLPAGKGRQALHRGEGGEGGRW